MLDENLLALRRRDAALAETLRREPASEEVEILRAKTGQPVPRAQGRLLHSLYDPLEEAHRWVEEAAGNSEPEESVVVLGLGFGYHLRALLDRGYRAITVIEPSRAWARCALEHCDCTDLFDQVDLRVGRSPDPAVLRRASRVLVHPPSRQRDPGLYDALKGRARLLGSLRVLVVGPVYGGSHPIARYCREALEDLGHRAEILDHGHAKELLFAIDPLTSRPPVRDALRGQLVAYLSEVTVARCAETRPDLVLALAQAPLTPQALIRIREMGIPTAFWFVEDYRIMGYWEQLAPLVDAFCVVQRGFRELLQKRGVAQAHDLPLAALPRVHAPLTLTEAEREEYGSALSFVGAGYPNRRRLFAGLTDLSLPGGFKIWGSDWRTDDALAPYLQRHGARMETAEIVKVFNAASIHLNLHSSMRHPGIDPDGDYVNPRTFELAACGAFQLVDPRSHLPELFQVGTEAIIFRSLEELKEQIRHYLEHSEARQETARRARERVLQEHTYQARMAELLGFLVERGVLRPPRAAHRVEDLMAQAGAGTSLGEHLGQFRGRETLTLEEIYQEIQQGEGSLTEVETLFLVMKELGG